MLRKDARRAALIAILPIMLVFVALPALAQGGLVYDPAANLLPAATVETSSMAGPSGSQYSSDGLNDNSMETIWATRQNSPLPQWIKVTFPEPTTIDTLVFVARDLPSFYYNVKTVRLEFSAGDPVDVEFDDAAGPHLTRFDPRTVEWFTFSVLEGHSENLYFGFHELMAFNDPQKRVRITVSPQQRWKRMRPTEQGREVHPCVFVTPEDVLRARENVKRYQWAGDYANAVVRKADQVLERSPEWIREHCPGKGAAFACGKTGCPICGGKWTIAGGWGGWTSADCDWDRPGTVRCENGHILPDAEHPDAGEGYTGPDGRIHYFVGSYNAWVIEQYQDWCHGLSLAYSLTADERYAEQCSVILDAIAEIYPTCTKGSWDYPSSPPSGRLARPWYQAARVLAPIVDDVDQIWNSPAMLEPSVVEGMTRRENIVTNMLKDGAWYCYVESLKGGLNNGEADYIRGSLAVGCLLGMDEYVDWAVDGPYGIRAMIFNNADRDGRYTETALGYALHARNLYLTFSEPLVNYRSEAYPDGLNLYDDPAFRSFYILPALAMSLAGHSPRYGDEGPDTRRSDPPTRPFNATDYMYAERIAVRATDPAVKESFGALVHMFANGDLDKLHAGASDREWLLFQATDIPGEGKPLPTDLRRVIEQTHLMGQKGVAILRTPPGGHQQACLLRFGPVLNHGHLDDLNINYVAVGYEVTYDLGYGDGATHTQVGWARQTAAHNLVMVDETRQLSSEADDTGGSLHIMASMPGLQLVDADANGVYATKGVSEYRRCVALVGSGPETYLLDIFSVNGGLQHDYMAHSLSTDISFEGLAMGERAEGSVAGPEFNWGERQTSDGYLSGVPRQNYWNPPPGNGLGFLMHPRTASVDGPWSATWKLPDGNSFLRLSMLPDAGTQVINAWAPGIYPNHPKAEHIIARRKSDAPLRSTFIGIREPYGRTSPEVGGIQGSELIGIASTDDGIIKYIGGYGILLFQAREPGGRIEFALEAPAAGEYYLHLAPYMSPSYGTVQFSLDGNALGGPFVATKPDVMPGPTQTFGPLTLAAGRHTLTATMVQSDRGEPWFSLSAINLTREQPTTDAPEPRPFIAAIERLPAPDGAAALSVKLVNGLVDRFIYSGEPCSTISGQIALDGCFSRIRTDADQVVAADLVGKALEAPGFAMELATGAHRGRIVRVDYQRNLVYVDAELPTDGRLDYEVVAFSNPAYSRNTAYTIRGIRREGDLSVIDLGPQRIILGLGTLDSDPPSDTVMTSLTPHEYAKGLVPGGTEFFQGKLLANADLSTQTHITKLKSEQPLEINVASTAGFSEGDTVYYMDLQAGDEFTIRTRASVRVDETGALSVVATDDVTVTIGDKTQKVEWKRGG